MTLSKEVRIGMLVAASAVILFTGFYFLKGSSLLSSEKEFYCFYPTVEGMQNSAAVQVNGLNSGRVSRMVLVPGKGVKVTIKVYKSVEIPEGTVASLASLDLLGTKMIKLTLGKGPGVLQGGTELPSVREGGVVENVSGELTPMLQKISKTIEIFDATLLNVNSILGAQNQEAIATAIQSIKATAANLATLSGTMSAESGQVSGILRNANSITGNLAKQNDTIKQILNNFNSISRQFANAPVQKTFTDLQKTTAELQGILSKINNNEGSMGMLVNNKDLYNNLSKSLGSMNNLMEDIQAHPKKYINITVFGKKTK